MRVLVFDIWGEYGHFRKYFTTSSPLTFSIPPPSSIAGILGAIYGTNKINGKTISNRYLEVFGCNECSVAVRIINPVRKIRMGVNLLDTKWSGPNAFRTQVKTEFLWRPKYRIYMTHEDDNIFNELENRLKNHESVYTVCLGLAYLLANFKYVGVFDGQPVQIDELVDVDTVVPVDIIKNLQIEPGKKYLKERIPACMDPDRVVRSYLDIVLEPSGKPIRIKALEDSVIKLENDEHITFLKPVFTSG